jgi:methionyl-tRNA formyltransferase
LNGDKETGVSVMRMIERLDAGDVLLQKKTPIAPDEDIVSLQGRLSALGAEAVLEALDRMERGNARFSAQNEMGATYTRKIAKSEGRVEWPSNAWDIHHRVRAFLGWPGTHFFFRGKRILVWKSELLTGRQDAAPGTVTDVSAERGLAVAAGSGTGLRLIELQLEGKKRLPWGEFRKGFALKTGDVLE